MRRLSLLTILIVLAGLAAAQDVKPTQPAPSASKAEPVAPSQLTPEQWAQMRHIAPQRMGQIIDQKGFLQFQGADSCLKLRKYVFQREDGSDRMKYVGETDCTRASRVQTESAGDPTPPPAPGLNKAVLKLRATEPASKQ